MKSYLSQIETIQPASVHLMTYSGPNDTCEDFPTGKLANMAGGFPFEALGHRWASTEHLYLCGEWTDPYIQRDLITAKSGYAAKRFKKNKYRRFIRPDFPSFRYDWMLWCVWQKCIGNVDFRRILLSVPDDATIVEVVKRDPVWAAYWGEDGCLHGGNAMGKILMICRSCLQQGTTPAIDYDLLNAADIYILGQRIQFSLDM